MVATPLASNNVNEDFLSYFKKGQRLKQKHGRQTAVAALSEDLLGAGVPETIADGLAKDILEGESESFERLFKEEDVPGIVEEPDEDEVHGDCDCDVKNDHVKCECEGKGTPAEEVPKTKGADPRADRPANRLRVFKDNDGIIISGPASVAKVDSENDLITGEALKTALPELLKRGRFSLQHTDILVGEILKEWEAPNGKTFKTEVRPVSPTDIQRYEMLQKADVDAGTEALFVVGKIYTGDEIGRDVAEDILKGDLKAFSISGQAVEQEQTTDCSGFTCKLVNEINKISLSAVTICDTGMNDASGFEVISKSRGGEGDGPVLMADSDGQVYKFASGDGGMVWLEEASENDVEKQDIAMEEEHTLHDDDDEDEEAIREESEADLEEYEEDLDEAIEEGDPEQAEDSAELVAHHAEDLQELDKALDDVLGVDDRSPVEKQLDSIIGKQWREAGPDEKRTDETVAIDPQGNRKYGEEAERVLQGPHGRGQGAMEAAEEAGESPEAAHRASGEAQRRAIEQQEGPGDPEYGVAEEMEGEESGGDTSSYDVDASESPGPYKVQDWLDEDVDPYELTAAYQEQAFEQGTGPGSGTSGFAQNMSELRTRWDLGDLSDEEFEQEVRSELVSYLERNPPDPSDQEFWDDYEQEGGYKIMSEEPSMNIESELNDILRKGPIETRTLQKYLYEAALDFHKGDFDRAGAAVAKLQKNEEQVKGYYEEMDRADQLDVHEAMGDFQSYIQELRRNLPDGDIEWLQDAASFIGDLDEYFADEMDEHAAHRDKAMKALEAEIGKQWREAGPQEKDTDQTVAINDATGDRKYGDEAERLLGESRSHEAGRQYAQAAEERGEERSPVGQEFPDFRGARRRARDRERRQEREGYGEADYGVAEGLEGGDGSLDQLSNELQSEYGHDEDILRQNMEWAQEEYETGANPEAIAREVTSALDIPSEERGEWQERIVDSLEDESQAEKMQKALGDDVMTQPITYGGRHPELNDAEFHGFPLDYPARPTAASSAHLTPSDDSSQKAPMGQEEDYIHPAGSDRTDDSANEDTTTGGRPSGFAMKDKYEEALDSILKAEEESGKPDGDLESTQSVPDNDEDGMYKTCPEHGDECPSECPNYEEKAEDLPPELEENTRDDPEDKDEIPEALEKTVKHLNLQNRISKHVYEFNRESARHRVQEMYKGTLSVIRDKAREDDAITEEEDEPEYEDRRLDETGDENEHEGSGADVDDEVWNGHEEARAREDREREEDLNGHEEEAEEALGDELLEKPKEVHDCVESLKEDGHDEDSAWAICESQHKSEGPHLHSEAFEAALNELTLKSDVPHRLTKSGDADVAKHFLAFAALGGEVFEKEYNGNCPACWKIYSELETPRKQFDAMKMSLEGPIDGSMLSEKQYLNFKDTFPIVYEEMTGRDMPRGMIP